MKERNGKCLWKGLVIIDHQVTGAHGRIKLLPLKKEDIERVRILRNESRKKFIHADIISREEQEIWFARYLDNPSELMFSAYHRQAGCWIGLAGIFSLDKVKKAGEFGRLIIDKKRVTESGLGVDTTLGVCQIAFKKLEIRRLYLEVYEDNTPAVKTYLRAGFQVYGASADSTGRSLLLMEKIGKGGQV